MPVILRVAVPVPLPELFDYLPPADVTIADIALGARLRVPFGARELIGVVVEHAEVAASPKLRAAISLFDPAPVFPEPLWRSLLWAARYYAYPLGEALASALPAPVRERLETAPSHRDLVLRLRPDPDQRAKLRDGSAPAAMYDALLDGPRNWTTLRVQIAQAATAKRRLLQLGLIDTLSLDDAPRRFQTTAPELNPGQANAVAQIIATLGGFTTTLLEGITGSGKTEVYLAAMQQVLARGEQVLVLVPEIGLTPQTVARFRERLAAPVLTWHSGLADGARGRAFERARSDSPLVVIGTRSAVFAPLPKLGLIIIDEEHDASFKQHEGFRYHARDVALVRAKHGVTAVVLGSATPALESLANVARGRYQHVRLDTRAGHAQPPTVEVIDVRRERLQDGLGAGVLSAIGDVVARGEQALVFRNRRGFAPVLHCIDCGWHSDCERCDRPYTLHRGRARLICHHCSRERPIPKQCPACNSDSLTPVGIGTERLEAALTQRFPQIPVLRLDRDSARSADQFERVLARAHAGEACILVGTQMLAKGHDLHGVTLAVIADADGGLYSADPRASERLAQLVVQVAGRAGRGARRGRVLIQTHHPEHALFRTLLSGGYPAFAHAELRLREALSLPPFSSQVILRAEARERPQIERFLRDAAAMVCHDGVSVAGPLAAPHARRAGYERAQLLLEAVQRRDLHAALEALLPQIYTHPLARKLRWSLDVDPIAVD
ncbi:MAG: primosomal protein N' [Rhodanobacteraceae bacterium]|nr:primosomal protein N' [Rhodanobacteraceae bacterium]MBK7044811.1 primosomal protein N' [Rhodanobacteraceae bacterium]MBP9154439.1 primosomal protein N' [Xanthomonadales bacterium]